MIDSMKLQISVALITTLLFGINIKAAFRGACGGIWCFRPPFRPPSYWPPQQPIFSNTRPWLTVQPQWGSQLYFTYPTSPLFSTKHPRTTKKPQLGFQTFTYSRSSLVSTENPRTTKESQLWIAENSQQQYSTNESPTWPKPLVTTESLSSEPLSSTESLWATNSVSNSSPESWSSDPKFAVIDPNDNDEPVNFTSAIITSDGELLCSACIISIHFVVSSCLRCLSDNKRVLAPQSIVIMVPEYPALNSGIGISFNAYDVERVVIHSECFSNGKYTPKYDIGLAKTIESIEFGPNVQPAKVPSPGWQPYIDKNLMITTLKLKNTGATTNREALWFVKVRTFTEESCAKLLSETFYDPYNTWCTPYYHSRGENNCKMDFGTALSYDDFLIGILIGKTYTCGAPSDSAATYVNVGLNSDWLRKKIQELTGNSESIELKQVH